MEKTESLNNDDNQIQIEDIEERKQKAINELYNYISEELKKNYYNFIDLLNNKNSIIDELLNKYNITDSKDIMQIYNEYDSFYRRLKNQANELRKQKIKTDAIIIELFLWIAFFTLVGLILG